MNSLPRVNLIQGGDSPEKPIQLVIDPKWREPVELACQLKDALDHAIRWPKDSAGHKSIESTLRQVGFATSDFLLGRHDLGPKNPNHFAQLLMGHWFSISEEDHPIGFVQVPAWSVMGWVYHHDWYVKTPELPLAEIIRLANSVPSHATKNDPAPSLSCLGGIPLFFAGEGKNRAHLFRLAQRPYVAGCKWYSLPPVENYTATRLAGTTNIVVLRGVDKNGRLFVEILPFGDLSRRLLEAAGVSWKNRPSYFGWFALLRTLYWKFENGDRACLHFWKVLKTIAADEKTKRLRLIGGFDFA